MDSSIVESGDDKISPTYIDNKRFVGEETIRPESENEEISKTFEDNELKLKDRIAQCRNIIEGLKVELNEEKSKLDKDGRASELLTISEPMPSYQDVKLYTDVNDICSSNMYSASVDGKINYDKNLIEYEKQLEKYEKTLKMAQIEKKNAIRKQMLTKAYRLKLLEVENQCNIELLRVKQSLQCVESLQMIASKWKNTNNVSSYDLDNYELLPRFPDFTTNSGSDIDSSKEDADYKALAEKFYVCEDPLSEC